MLSTDIKPGEMYGLRPNYRGPIENLKVIRTHPGAHYRGGAVLASVVRDNSTMNAPELFSGYYFAERINDVVRTDALMEVQH